MGGRLVTELAADEPERALSVILLDAIVGETWDQLVTLFRVNPLAARPGSARCSLARLGRPPCRCSATRARP